MDSQGWLHTGDVATLEEDGHLRFMGRYKELLKVGGENVDPVEVEAFLLGHPALHKVQVGGGCPTSASARWPAPAWFPRTATRSRPRS